VDAPSYRSSKSFVPWRAPDGSVSIRAAWLVAREAGCLARGVGDELRRGPRAGR
jgi:hypothetical protein